MPPFTPGGEERKIAHLHTFNGKRAQCALFLFCAARSGLQPLLPVLSGRTGGHPVEVSKKGGKIVVADFEPIRK